MSSLDEARSELERNPPPPVTLTDHPMAMRWLGERLDERDKQQGEAADPAA
jgi:hypothetical protein